MRNGRRRAWERVKEKKEFGGGRNRREWWREREELGEVGVEERGWEEEGLGGIGMGEEGSWREGWVEEGMEERMEAEGEGWEE